MYLCVQEWLCMCHDICVRTTWEFFLYCVDLERRLAGMAIRWAISATFFLLIFEIGIQGNGFYCGVLINVCHYVFCPSSPLPFLTHLLHLPCWLPSSPHVICILPSFLVFLSLAIPPPIHSFLWFFCTAVYVCPLIKFVNCVILLLILVFFFQPLRNIPENLPAWCYMTISPSKLFFFLCVTWNHNIVKFL